MLQARVGRGAMFADKDSTLGKPRLRQAAQGLAGHGKVVNGDLAN